jgi:hypothetical protein
MRYFCIASSIAAAFVAMTAAPALADKAPWCAFLGGGRDGGGTECLYYTIAQCRATVSGLGGFCFENPNYKSSRNARSRNRD